jgi:hypothetical protein
MKGSEFCKTLPKAAGPRREKMLLDAVRRRDIAPIEWVPITTEIARPNGGKYTAKIFVSKDALRVGDATDSFRFSVSHRTAQHIADALDTVLPTPYLSDQIWKQADVKLQSLAEARNWWQDGTMADTDRMLEQSRRVDKLIAAEIAKTGKHGLIADVGKDWVTHPELWQPYVPKPGCETGHPRAMNYGWHLLSFPQSPYYASTLPGISVIQPAARCHTIPHVDYSQVVRLVRRDVDVCGKWGFKTGCVKIDIRQIATSPELHGLVSASGPLEAMRHPDVPPSCDKRCPTPVQTTFKPADESNGDQPAEPLQEPPPEVGPLSCPTGCDELPKIEPDPTFGLQASMSAADKVVMLSAGGVLGYLAVRLILPRL